MGCINYCAALDWRVGYTDGPALGCATALLLYCLQEALHYARQNFRVANRDAGRANWSKVWERLCALWLCPGACSVTCVLNFEIRCSSMLCAVCQRLLTNGWMKHSPQP